MRLAIVSATLDIDRATPAITSWIAPATHPPPFYLVRQGDVTVPWEKFSAGPVQGWVIGTSEILGVVPAFAIGVQKALEDGADIIAAIHDDLEIHQDGWDETILDWFETHPRCGLLGFGGGRGLGDPNLYNKPYDPMQLARRDFVSNMVDAEAHGRRVLVPTQVACLDGMSLIGRREFWEGINSLDGSRWADQNILAVMAGWNIRHHAYDSATGCWAKRLNWEVWMLPIRVHHLGGQTAVGDPRYAEWALTQHLEGDAGFWQDAHRIVWTQFRDVLPIGIEEEQGAHPTAHT